MTLDYLTYLLSVGLQSMQEYLALYVLMCLIPVFFLADAIDSLLSRVPVCSCTVLPLFAGIYKRGALFSFIGTGELSSGLAEKGTVIRALEQSFAVRGYLEETDSAGVKNARKTE